MPARCVLVAGPGGAGSSRYAASLACAYAARERSVLLIGTDSIDDATSMTGASGGYLRSASIGDELPGREPTFGPLLDLVGLDPRLSAELGLLSETTTFRLLQHLATNVGPEETVVIDAGSRAVDLVRLAGAAPWIVQRLAPAQRGWLGSARPLLASALGTRWPGEGMSQAVQEAALHATSARELLLGDRSAAVVVAGGAPIAKVRRVIVGLALNSASVTATIGAGHRAAIDPVDWSAGRPIDAQIDDLDEFARGTRIGAVSWEREADDYVWRMPLPSVTSRDLELRMVQDDLVLSALGHRSVIPMPTVLRRCRPQDAGVRDAVLTVRFVPVRQDEACDRRQ